MIKNNFINDKTVAYAVHTFDFYIAFTSCVDAWADPKASLRY